MNTLETHVLELIGEDTANPDVFSEGSDDMDQIRASINDAIQEISMLTGAYKQTYILPLREDRSFYRIGLTRGEVAWITDAWLTVQNRRLEQTDLTRLNEFNPRWLFNTGTPEAYFPIGTNWIGFWPYPVSDGSIVELTMCVIPDRYEEDTDRVKLRNDFHWAAVHLAVSEFWASRGDAKSANRELEKYLEWLGIQTGYQSSNESPTYYRSSKAPWPKGTG